MENKTQCPNCLSKFVISDEQFQKSHGNVRCGACREPFLAVLIKGHQKDVYANIEVETDISVEQPSIQSHDFDSELSIEIEDKDSVSPPNSEELLEPEFKQAELDMPIKQNAGPVENQKPISIVEHQIVEHPVEDKLIADKSKPEEPDVFLNQQQKTLNKNWLASLLLGIVCLILLCGLVFQLWQRQAISWLDDESVVKIIEPIAEPIIGQLYESLGVKLPLRRDLKNLQLLSARTEAHPSRSSTILLRVSLINHSKISQPYPWLELSLTDENGRLVARRALSPDDYLHNNQVDNHIGARELRPVTIEFLSFPKQANGYELKILNN